MKTVNKNDKRPPGEQTEWPFVVCGLINNSAWVKKMARLFSDPSNSREELYTLNSARESTATEYWKLETRLIHYQQTETIS
jgi:hypothetical protein